MGTQPGQQSLQRVCVERRRVSTSVAVIGSANLKLETP